MSHTLIRTPANPYGLLFPTNNTSIASAITDPVATFTAPYSQTGGAYGTSPTYGSVPAGVIECGGTNADNPGNYLELMFFGRASGTFNAKVYRWKRANNSGLWIPTVLADLTVTLGSLAGADDGNATHISPAAADMFGTIAVTIGKSLSANAEILPSDPTVLKIDPFGAQAIQVIIGGGTAGGTTQGNGLYAWY